MDEPADAKRFAKTEEIGTSTFCKVLSPTQGWMSLVGPQGWMSLIEPQSVDYAKERRQFNRVIGSFQAVKHMCSEMAAELEPCRSLAWYTAHAYSAIPEEGRLMACHAKAHLSEVGKLVARKSTEVHGGIGITDLLGLHYWFKRIGFNRQLLGAPELVREEAARVQEWV